MPIAVTGATGHLGRLTVESLLERGVPADQIVAIGRRIETLDDLVARGVQVRRADYSDEAALRSALEGVERLLLVSGNEVGQRVAQHATVLEAAKSTGVRHIAYTSIPHADVSTLLLAEEHRGTEQVLAGSGLPYTFLRNSWYLENYTAQLPVYAEHGIAGAAGAGRISAATRADFAAAAAAVLTEDGHEGMVYELGGPAFGMPELAEAVSEALGRPVTYTDLPVEAYQAVLVGAGLPEGAATTIADGDRGAVNGELEVDPADLEKLLGRPATPMRTAIAEAARALAV